MIANKHLATEVFIDEAAKSLSLTWADEHVSCYPWWYLRGFCPCAQCQGHQPGTQFIATETFFLSTVQEVGNYALNLVWDETHTTGIYTFEFLRAMCPCLQHAAATLAQVSQARKIP